MAAASAIMQPCTRPALKINHAVPMMEIHAAQDSNEIALLITPEKFLKRGGTR